MKMHKLLILVFILPLFCGCKEEKKETVSQSVTLSSKNSTKSETKKPFV